MTALGAKLRERIARTGPITVADYMAECLFHPEHGYYTNADPFGAEGDFVTAPEVSQMFGEMIGLCLAQHWLDEGSPSRIALAELGPGRGSLMKDILRTIASVPGLTEAADIFLVEASAKLAGIQQETLAQAKATWVGKISDLPDDLPLYIIGNEFFDALPIRQFVRKDTGWSERMIGLEADTLTLGLSPSAPIALLSDRLDDTENGDIVETCPQAQTIMSEVDRRIANNGGLALFIDYGDWRSLGDTLQAVRQHAFVNVLAEPGLADLTAHVDFEALVAAAPELQPFPLVTQGVFLERLGITARAQALAASATPETVYKIVAQHRRLTHPDEMGSLFKVLGLARKGAKTPAGFSTHGS